MPGLLRPLLATLLAGSAAALDLDRLAACTVMVGDGSGVVVAPDGLVLTNHHVAGGLARTEVRFADGRAVPARLLGSDPVGDIALLRLDDRGPHPFAALRDLPPPPPGSAVVAVGNPFGLGDLDDRPSLAFGVLSTGPVARGDYPDCLVHDAAVNPGNSGGPLFSADDGRLLGINGRIRSRSGLRINSGIGLAISAAQLIAFAPRLESAPGGLVRRTAPPAGLAVADGPDGPLVAAAPDGGPLRPGDRVLAVAGAAVASAAAVRSRCTALPWAPGAAVPVRVRRGEAELDLAVPAPPTPIPGRPWSGLTVEERGGLLLVATVADGSAAEAAGVRPGERLLAAAGRPLRERTDWLAALAGLGIGDPVELELGGSGTRCAVLWLRPEPDGE